jgi:hypothetical protein
VTTFCKTRLNGTESPLQNRKKTRPTGEAGKKRRQMTKNTISVRKEKSGRKHEETGK